VLHHMFSQFLNQNWPLIKSRCIFYLKICKKKSIQKAIYFADNRFRFNSWPINHMLCNLFRPFFHFKIAIYESIENYIIDRAKTRKIQMILKNIKSKMNK
jgi:hypothetical protein